jgi:5'-nucleotidase/UDP-sugar diphosphatase
MRLFLLGLIASMSLQTLLAAQAPHRLQLLHTNDLHGFHEHTVFDNNLGGYAALKNKMDDLKQQAKSNSLETLAMDAGDFMEGSIFYMVDQGRFNLEMMSAIGYDFVALGNHDWLMGTKELASMLEMTPLSFDILCANLEMPNYKGLKKIQPYKIRQIGPYKVAIMGLTTNEMYYRWRFDNVDIKDPIKVAKKLARRLKEKEGVDFIIAVTHLGYDTDKLLAREVGELDLIVGGHSHTDLHKPVYARVSGSTKKIPIVQTGEHAHYLGELMLTLKPGKLIIDSYQLHPIKHSEGKDNHIQTLVDDARQRLNNVYGTDRLLRNVGESEIDLISSEAEPTAWNAIIADAMKESLQTDFSVHSAGFAGTDIPKGAVTLEHVMQAYPRYFDLEDPNGWRLYKVNVKGIVVSFLLNAFLSRPNGLTFSGVTFNVDRSNKKLIKATNVRINNRPLKAWATYSVALPEGVVRGGIGLTKFIRYILQTVGKSSTPIWQAISKKVESMGTIKRNYSDELLQDTLVLDNNSELAQAKGNKSLSGKNSTNARYIFVPKRVSETPDEL